MNVETQIHTALQNALSPIQLKVINESRLHTGHAGDDGSGESHYAIEITSPLFEGKSRVERHRMIFAILEDSLVSLPHAISIKASDL
jgi:BolA protein